MDVSDNVEFPIEGRGNWRRRRRKRRRSLRRRSSLRRSLRHAGVGFIANEGWRSSPIGKPLASTLLTSTFVLDPGVRLWGELEWSLVATSLEGFSVTGCEKRVPGNLCKRIIRVRGALPGAKNQGGHVKSGV